ncbi:MAG: diaminopimelate decarboxylase [Nitrospinae bacterium]|nr:diaminopimelate decarboxylase [Nitrospinota bacterium]
MHDFQFKDAELFAEKIPVRKIIEEVGTPFYLYSANTISNHFKAFDSAFEKVPHTVCFAAKSCSNIAILRLLAGLGAGMDIVSGGELHRALLAGVDPGKIVYAGVGKTKEEIKYALETGIMMFNVESTQELFAIDEAAEDLGKKARVSLRVNPDVDPKTHPYISTGLKQNKFGINIDDAFEEYKLAKGLENIEVVGIQKHIGSQITQISPFVDALEKVVNLANRLRDEAGINIQYLDIGGGLGITYKDESPPHPRELAAAIVPMLEKTGYTIVFEPGRLIMGNAGVLVAKVLYTKVNEGKNFVIVDAGMNDLVRPSLYGSYQEIIPVVKKNGKPKIVADIVGPICESGDFLAKDRTLPTFEQGDFLAVMSAGAYGFSMSSNYNSRPRVAEVLVKGDEFHVIRRRESYEDLVRGEEIPAFLK